MGLALEADPVSIAVDGGTAQAVDRAIAPGKQRRKDRSGR
jgi:hypothetical protein